MNLYHNIVLGTSICASVITLIFAVLVLRRYVAEKGRVRRDNREKEITRSYLQRVAGHKAELVSSWPLKTRQAAISRILPLLRGGERTRLLQLAELDGVLGETLRVSHSLRSGERISAIHSLQRFGSEVCIGRLREMMARDRNLAVRIEAAFALGSHGALPPPRETLRILSAFKRSPTRLDTALLRSTAPLFPEQMLMLLSDDLPQKWLPQIIDALGWSENLSVIETLGAKVQDPDPDIRCAALRALSRLGHPVAQKWVINGLQDPIPSVRLQAITTSIRLGLADVIPELYRLREDEELWVKLRAAEALDHFERQGAIQDRKAIV